MSDRAGMTTYVGWLLFMPVPTSMLATTVIAMAALSMVIDWWGRS